jgi:hypothetical protein
MEEDGVLIASLSLDDIASTWDADHLIFMLMLEELQCASALLGKTLQVF